jgi:uncharacterized protein (TIGR02284 family)
MTTTKAADTLNSLLRGELAATETYQQALEKIGNDAGASELRQIHVDHREAANTLRQHVHNVGGTPDQGSGAWGAFAKAVEGTAKLFGNTSALKALKEGEEHGVKSYENVLQDSDLPTECQTLVRTVLCRAPRASQRLARPAVAVGEVIGFGPLLANLNSEPVVARQINVGDGHQR